MIKLLKKLINYVISIKKPTTEYVLGFAFSRDLKQVALIRKKRPEWQAGKLNGIGGKVNINEVPILAMVREFQEEACLQTDILDWVEVDTLYRNNDIVAIYCFATCVDNINTVTTWEDEFVGWYHVRKVDSNETVEGLVDLIDLAQTRMYLHNHFGDNNVQR